MGVDAVVVGEQYSHGPPFRTRLKLRRARSSADGPYAQRSHEGGSAEPNRRSDGLWLIVYGEPDLDFEVLSKV